MSLKKKVLIILFIAFLFRMFLIFYLPVRPMEFEDNIRRYHFTAINLLEGRGYSHYKSEPYKPTIVKPPTYSFFLAGVYKLFGVNYTAVRIIQILLDTLACLLLFSLARDYFPHRVALTIMMLAAVCPITAVYANSRTPESLTIFLMVLCLWFISKSLIYNKGLYFFGAGLASILMGYSRPEFFSFIFIFGLLLFLLNLKKRNKLKVLLLYAAGIAIIMVPWTLRNYSLTGRFIPLSLGGARGISFYLGTLEKETYCDANFIKFLNENPEVKQLFYERYQYGPLYDSSVTYDEYCKYEDIFTKMAIDRILSNPWGYLLARLRTIPRVWINLHANEFTFLNTQKLRLFHPDLRKIVYFTREDPKQVLILIAKYVLFAINIFYLLMALKGLWVLRARLLGLIFIIAPLIYAQALFMVIVISANYTVPYWPSIIFFSGVGYSYTFGLKKLERTES